VIHFCAWAGARPSPASVACGLVFNDMTQTDREGGCIVDYKLELVLIPVSDVDRAKTFYTEKVGFNLDVDTTPGEGFRVV
jgi:hypothetical protein